MPNVDLTNEYTFHMSVEPDNYLADQNGTSVDLNDHGPEVTVVLMVGESDGSDATYDGELEESADDSTFTDVTGGSVTQIDNAGHAIQTVTVYNRAQRYVRGVLNMGGASPSADAAILLIARKSSY